MTLLGCIGVSAGYGEIVAVHQVDLEVAAGEIVAVLGANGAGKSTLLRAISGMLPLKSGDIVVGGRSIRGMGSEGVARLGIAHVPEGRGVFSNLSVMDNLRMGLYGAGQRGQAAARRLDEACSMFPVLGARRAQRAGTLSGGEQQMLAIARALVQSPHLLLLDEMSMGLGPAVVQQLFGVVGEIAAKGTAVLMVEQFVAQALRIASRAYVLEKGRVAFAGKAAALADREEVVTAYLGRTDDGGAKRVTRGGERVTVTLNPGLVRRLEKRAECTGQPLDQMLAVALTRGVEEGEAEEAEPGGSGRRRRPKHVAAGDLRR